MLTSFMSGEIAEVGSWFIGALVFAFVVTPYVRRAAIRVRAMDMPDARKVHTEPVPRLGGVAVILSAALALSAYPLLINRGVLPPFREMIPWIGLLVAVTVMLCLGALDDVKSLPARRKFAIEIGAAALLLFAWGAPVAVDFSPFFGSIELGWAGPVVGILWIVGLTNALNMLDVVDGAAVGVGAIAAVAGALVAGLLGYGAGRIVLLSLAGGLLGFLPHNLRKRMFLGDSGSLTVGFILAAATLLWFQRNGSWLVLPAVLVVGLPLAECALTLVRRSLKALAIVRVDGPRERYVLRRGAAGLFIPDRRHVPHRLIDLGLNLPQTIMVLYALGIVLGLLGVGTVRLPWVGPLAGLILIAAVVYLAPKWLYEELRVLQRGALLPMLESRLVRHRLAQASYDAVVVAGAYLFARWVEGQTGAHAVELAAVVVAALAGFWFTGLYRATYRHAGVHDVLGAVWSVLFGVVLAAGASVIGIGSAFEAGTWFLVFYLVLSGVLVARLSFRVLDHLRQRAPRAGRRALIFGAGRAGGLALGEMLSNPSLELVPVGFLDDDPTMRLKSFHGYPVYGEGQQLEFLMRSLRVDLLVISTDKADPARLAAAAAACRICGVRVVRFELRWDASGQVRDAVEPAHELHPNSMENKG